MAIIIEVLNKQHKVTERHKFSQHRVALGRAYDNDVILYDKHICPHHAELVLDEEGQWILRDLASMNGSYLQPKQPLTEPQQLQSGQLCWLGEQAVRIYDDAHQVAPALPFNPLEQRLLRCGHLGLILLLLLFMLFEEVFHIWLAAPEQQQAQWSRSLVNLPLLLLVLTLWPAVLALWSKINQHEARFLPQLGITFIGLSVMAVWQALMVIMNFSFDGAAAINWLQEAGRLVILTLLLGANFYLAMQISVFKKMAMAFGLALLLSVQSLGLGFWFDESRQLAPQFDHSLLPLSFYLNTAVSAEDFAQSSNSLFEAAAKERQEQD
ncbi:FHA domain-containing protein [Rheinheimera sp.]|uniref:FHA domain-containing protein n=1 Tax=Rheinheimera sp. TaxID=1869214 RepID=UPI0027BA94D0|nr:FHA domain-containing protein [Rheinheimera sp.]